MSTLKNSVPEIPDFQILRVGSAPVIRQLIDEIDLIERIDKLSPLQAEDCKLSVGTRVAALIINQLTDRKALYKVNEFYESQDVNLLFGPNVQADDFNDDALARALDALYRAGLDKVYWQAAQGAVLASGTISWNQLHFDTTSMIYTGEVKDEAPLKIVRGYSKDHRPDLPQIKIGMRTTGEGLPIYGEALDGNQDDKTWNPHVMKAVTRWLSPEQLRQAIFISDSAFVTEDSLKGVKREDRTDLHFISRLPETFKVAKTLKEQAWAADDWQKVGQLSRPKDAATYWMYPAKAKLYGETYRYLVVYSNKLDGRKKEPSIRN
jgi:transposase